MSSSMPSNPDRFSGSWRQRLSSVVDMMRDISMHTDPQQMVLAYADRVAQMMPMDRLVSVSRRGLEPPAYRITRSTVWGLDRNPWRDADKLPMFAGGLMGDLLYADEPRILDHVQIAPDDPAAEFLDGMRSIMAIPVYDRGVALNMVLLMRREPEAFDRDRLPDQVWTTNLFGRATHNLVLSSRLHEAYQNLDRQMQIIGDLQRSLLPRRLPAIPTMELAVHYQPAARSGGDYYDVFPMADDAWGIMIADVSGHGSPATVLMAVTHALVHTLASPTNRPAQVLDDVNHHLTRRYTRDTGRFVTAFFGVYRPAARLLTYARAGHDPPRLKRCRDGSMFCLDRIGNPPLGIIPDQSYDQTTQSLEAGDQIVCYTDGVTEAFNSAHEMFGPQRLDEALVNCSLDASGLITAVLSALDRFTGGREAGDDRTLLVAKIT